MATGFLQGIAFVDANGNNVLDSNEARKANTQILLQDGSGAAITSTTTDSNGFYRFSGLGSGSFRLVEVAPSGFTSQGTQILSTALVNSASQTNASTIAVTLPDYDQLRLTVQGRGVTSPLQYNFRGTVRDSNAGQYIANATAPGFSGPTFTTYCDDLEHPIAPPTTYDVDPSPVPPALNTAGNAGKVAYFYNRYGQANLSPSQAAGLQVALWEMIYHATISLNTGDFQLLSAVDPAVVTAASNYLSEASTAPTEVAVSLVNPTIQNMLAPQSFNFAN